jgi:hypothetical protein
LVGLAESVEFGVPAGYAFDFLADPSTATVIDPAVREYTPDTSPMRVGTRNRIRLRIWGFPVRAVSIVEAWEPGHRMVMVSERPARPVRVSATHRFDPLGPERCRYTWQVDLVATMPLGSLAARLLCRALRANVAAQQQRFKAEVERRWSAAATATDTGA